MWKHVQIKYDLYANRIERAKIENRKTRPNQIWLVILYANKETPALLLQQSVFLGLKKGWHFVLMALIPGVIFLPGVKFLLGVKFLPGVKYILPGVKYISYPEWNSYQESNSYQKSNSYQESKMIGQKPGFTVANLSSLKTRLNVLLQPFPKIP